jgi:hypothetical protein
MDISICMSLWHAYVLHLLYRGYAYHYIPIWCVYVPVRIPRVKSDFWLSNPTRWPRMNES